MTPSTTAKGSWAQVIASLTYDTYGLLICLNSNSNSTASRNTVVDIGIGGSGSEIVLIPDLICGSATTYSSPGGGVWYYFPIAIPAGTRVVARAHSTVTTALRVFVQAFQEPANPSLIKKASLVEAIGIVSGNLGTAVTAGTVTEGSWTLLGTTTERLWWWQVGAQVSVADTGHAAGITHIDLAVGDGTTFDIIMQDAYVHTTTSEQISMPPLTIGCEFPVPAGSDIYVRMQCNTTPDSFNLCAYGAGG